MNLIAVRPEHLAADIGILIARFQTHMLHPGHVEVLREVAAHHKQVVVLLGVAPIPSTIRNPLDFQTRKLLVESTWESEALDSKSSLTVLPVHDASTDVAWQMSLDSTIAQLFKNKTIVLYGGRDSFVSHYNGIYPVVTIDIDQFYSASNIRKELSNSVLHSPDFRAGCIYATFQRFPAVITTVDMVIYDPEKDRILLGKRDSQRFYRLVGGFSDLQDTSFEAAASREVMEETKLVISVSDMSYIGSYRINDWRYRAVSEMKVNTVLFLARYTFGAPEPSDDIDELAWVQREAFVCDLDDTVSKTTPAIMFKIGDKAWSVGAVHVHLLLAAFRYIEKKFNKLPVKGHEKKSDIGDGQLQNDSRSPVPAKD